MQKKVADWFFFLGSPAFIWQILFFYLPIALLFCSGFFLYDEYGTFLGLTFSNFVSFLTLTSLSILSKTLFISILTALICACLAYPLAYFIAFTAKKYRYVLLFFVIVPFWTNFLLHVYAWFFILEPGGILNDILLSLGLISHPIHFFNSIFSIVLMMVYMYLPFMVLPLYSALERFQKECIEASYDLGAGWLQTFSRVVFPITLPSLKAGFFLVLIPSFGEFIIPELMGGDKYYFAGNVITQLILGDQTGQLGAAFAVVSILFLLLSLLLLMKCFDWFSKKLDRRT